MAIWQTWVLSGLKRTYCASGGADRALDRPKVKAWVSRPGSRTGQRGKPLANSRRELRANGKRLPSAPWQRPNPAMSPIRSATNDAAHKGPPLRHQYYVAPERSLYKVVRRASAL